MGPWEVDELLALMERLYGVHNMRNGKDLSMWTLASSGIFQVKSFSHTLCGGGNPSFPWKYMGTWAPSKVAFFFVEWSTRDDFDY